MNDLIPRMTVRDHDDLHVLLAGVENIRDNCKHNLAHIRGAKSVLDAIPEMAEMLEPYADADLQEGEMLLARIESVLSVLQEIHGRMIADNVPLVDSSQTYLDDRVDIPNDGANTPPLDPTLN